MDITELKELANSANFSPEESERVQALLSELETNGALSLGSKNELLALVNASLKNAQKEDAKMESMEKVLSKIEALTTH